MSFAQRAFAHGVQVLSARVSLHTLVACLLVRTGAERAYLHTKRGEKRRKVKDIRLRRSGCPILVSKIQLP